MRILVAAAAGMCFGVRDALDELARIDRPHDCAIYGELVHNDVVLYQLESRGFQNIAETQRSSVPDAPNIVVTAHGISQRRRRQLVDAGKTLIDTTCPLVTRVHRAAQELAESGAFVVVIGRPDHVEVEGITGDLESFAVVTSTDDVGVYTSARIGVVCQTTFPTQEAHTILREIRARNPASEIEWIDTICQPTKDRQQALAELLDRVQVVVVVGGRRSHNTLRLIDTCRQRGLTAYHVEDSQDLLPEWFTGIETVGLTAGTSTLPETVQHVHDRLVEIASLGGQLCES